MFGEKDFADSSVLERTLSLASRLRKCYIVGLMVTLIIYICAVGWFPALDLS
jgi:hypothetical protein